MALCSYSHLPPLPMLHVKFWKVLVSWDCQWIWDHVQVVISTSMRIAVADSLYIHEVTTEVCNTPFFIENTNRTCKLVGASPKRLEMGGATWTDGCTLDLLAINKVAPGLAGSKSVESLPTLKIPSQYIHSDILKNILVDCSDLSFAIDYPHMSAHQDKNTPFLQWMLVQSNRFTTWILQQHYTNTSVL